MIEETNDIFKNMDDISRSDSDKLFLEISSYYELVYGEEAAKNFIEKVTSLKFHELAKNKEIFDSNFFYDAFNYVSLSLGLKTAKSMLSSISSGHWLRENDKKGGGESLTQTSKEIDEFKSPESLKDLMALVPLLMGLSLDLRTLHWNWNGENFLVYHELLDGWSSTFSESADELAEMLIGSMPASRIVCERISCTPSAMTSIRGTEGVPLVGLGEEHNSDFLYRLLNYYIVYIKSLLEESLDPAHEDFLVGLLREMMTMKSHVTPRVR